MNVIQRLPFGNKRSIRFYKYFLSYVLIVVTLLGIIGSVVYSQLIGTLHDEVESANIAALTHIRDAMDMRFREMQRIAVQVSKNPLLTPYMMTQSGYQSYQAVGELNKYRFGNSFIFNIGLVFSHTSDRSLYTADGVYENDYFFKTIFKYANWSEEAFFRTIETATKPTIRPMEDVLLNGASAGRFSTYLYPLPANSGKPYGSVVFILDERTLNGMVSPLLHKYNGAFFLVDERSEPIFSVNGQGPASDSKDLWSEVRRTPMPHMINSVQVAGTTYSVVKLPSTYNEWSYVTLIPTERFLKTVETSRQIFVVALFAILLLGLALSFSLANQNYQKLRELVRIFRERKGDGESMSGTVDELVYLSDAIRETAEQQSVMGKLKSRTGLLREKLILSLLQGKADKLDDLENLIELSGIRFEHPQYVVLLLVIDDYREFLQKHPDSMQDLFKFSIINVAEELAGEIGRGCGIDLAEGRGIALVLNLPSLGREKHALREMGLRIQGFFKTYYKFTLSIGIGRSVGELGGLRASFVDAERALFYRFVKGNGQLLFSEELQETSPGGRYSYPMEMEDQLIKAIRQGKQDEVARTIRGMLGYITSISETPESAHSACMGLVHMVGRTINEMDDDAKPRWCSAIDELLRDPHETIDHLERELTRLCQDVCESMTYKKESRNFELRDNILEYIEKHYADSNLSLEKIAAHFGMSPSYITRFIKDQTGQPLIRYLDQLRLQKTKELLRTTSITMSEVAERVGYVDISNFIRKFKKAEGLTPAQYRLLLHKNPEPGEREEANS